MNKWLVVALVVSSGSAFARDTKYILKIADVLSMPEAAGRLDAKIGLYFGKQPFPAGENRGEVVANPKTNSANKSDEDACRWVMLSALMDLQKRARAMGATAVVNIESFYKKVPFSSETEFECHAGGFLTGVALRGSMIK
ncbi:MAG: excinuclease ATPase subunit [Archangium sp.]|nr:excinuclease ATPase subunit [Archangium sp.]MDP3574121.1 excinuclease ATPase subunit [Archangium sp.]